MSHPFYDAIKGTTAGTPGTGSFTPNAAATGFEAWSGVAAGWIGMVRYEDGSGWERSYGYWNGTAITRPANGFVASSSGSQLSLTSAATASLVIESDALLPHLTNCYLRNFTPTGGGQMGSDHGGGRGPTLVGTGATVGSVTTTNFLTEQQRSQTDSATTANAMCGWNGQGTSDMRDPQVVNSTTAGRGGWEFRARFGAVQLPTAPKLGVGMTSANWTSAATEPSDLTAHTAWFSKDSGDTNIQLVTNDNSGSGGKTDTGIALVANGWYEARVWAPPGCAAVYGLLIRLDTGAIWYGSRNSNLPGTAVLIPVIKGALHSTTGTAFQLCCGMFSVRHAI